MENESNPLETFTFKGSSYHYEIKFFTDHIAFRYDEMGAGKNVVEKKVNKRNLGSDFDTQITFGWLAGRAFKNALAWFVLFVLFFYLFDNWVQYLAWPFLAMCVGAVILGLTRVKKLEWITLLREDGGKAFAFGASKKDQSQLREFKRYFSEYMKSAEQGVGGNA